MSKLLSIVRNNGTGVLKGLFRSSEPISDFSKVKEVAVLFSVGETFLGKHLLLIEKIHDGWVSCSILKNNKEQYNPFESSGGNGFVYIALVPFSHDKGGCAGEFFIEFPQISI